MVEWTTSLIPDLAGKIILITGANSGLGFESAKALAGKGATVIMACRNLEKGEKARQQIREEIRGNDPDLRKLDLADLSSVEDFVSGIQSDYNRIDVLMNNAGIMATPYEKTKSGFEKQFGVNHLGHFALTGRLLNLLLKTPCSRVVNVSSMSSRRGKINFDNLMGERSYKPWRAYGQSKLANLLFTFELQRRIDAHQADIIAVAAHPGISATNLHRAMSVNESLKFIYDNLFKGLIPDAAKGALSQLYAATSPEAQPGGYYGPGGWFEAAGYPSVASVPAQAQDRETALRLWEISEKLTGVIDAFVR
ncbi:MAG: SDR family oxidoreductase [Cyclobacteriaceae bacterium]|nr:SDR family oxidoreductase [Cyclobacteriaceae bacterium]